MTRHTRDRIDVLYDNAVRLHNDAVEIDEPDLRILIAPEIGGVTTSLVLITTNPKQAALIRDFVQTLED